MNDELFHELLASVKQGAEIMKGTMQPSRTFEFPETEVRALREQFGLSQDKFADLVGISVGTLRNWEQGRRKPEGPARVLLRVASRHPEALLDIEKEQSKRADRAPSHSTGRTKKLCAA
ncbi:MAG: helix-turn-helix domain-containing protein [Deltaproteobacteria bacterium]|nr:helix-turn-helix domain-containing protein [Deltaproteobacteria bacterium]